MVEVLTPGGGEEPTPPVGARGIVYILTNLAVPGIIKIGLTTGPLATRLRQLDTTGVPLPFECAFAAEVTDVAFVERRLHAAFADARLRLSREFFRISPDRVRAALDLARGVDVTPRTDIVDSPADQETLNRERSRRAVFRFSMTNILPGAVLNSIFDPAITCEVADDRKVRFRGELHSLSSAATVIAQERGRESGAPGPYCWLYDGKTLDELRNDREADLNAT